MNQANQANQANQVNQMNQANQVNQLFKKHKYCLAMLLSCMMLFLSACGNQSADTSAQNQTEQTTGTENAGTENAGTEDTGTEDTGTAGTGAEVEAGEVEVIEPAPALSFEGSPVADSELYVEAIPGMSDEFLRGVDISSYLSEIESGVQYQDFEGNILDEQGFFNLLAQAGVNCVRIRVWNDPYDKNGNSYGGGHNDVQTAVTLGKWATKAGLQVAIDFHYSDFWADPGKQMAPKEWAHYTIEDKEQALYDFTQDSLNILLDAGVNVTLVQIGNETNNGMAGEKDWGRIGGLMRKGSEAIRATASLHNKDIKIAVHFTNPDSAGFPDFAKKIEEKEVDYDVFATSYYPFWHGTLDNLTEKLTLIANTYNKEVMVVETSYVYTMENSDGNSDSVTEETTGIVLDYDISVQGQANVVRAVAEAVCAVGDARIGVFYWEPAWIPVQVYEGADNPNQVLEENKQIWEKYGSGWASSYAGKYDPKDAGVYYGGSSWDNQAMFDFEGKPLESLNIFKYMFSGTNAPLTIIRVDDLVMESGIGQELKMPEQIPARLINNGTKDIPVTWDEQQVADANAGGAGFYTISGVATDDEIDYNVNAELEIKKVNYIKNAGFEDADMSMWEIDGDGVDREADNNKKSGTYSLKFWKEQEVAFEVQQEIKDIPAGTYELGAFLQGGDAGSNPVFQLSITVNGETTIADTGVTSWQNWDNPVISDIVIPEGATVSVGVKVDAGKGAWGAWDDFTLYDMNN